jgi:antitoxin (DNA-binding transcriptional repressor) of toxin-antitoxin stability system
MSKATVRQLPYRFPEIEAHLNKGEEIEVYKRKKMIGRLLPVRLKSEAYPDSAALSRRKKDEKDRQRTSSLIAYADTRFLLSLYGHDDHSAAAISLVKSRPVFLLTALARTEFTNAIELACSGKSGHGPKRGPSTSSSCSIKEKASFAQNLWKKRWFFPAGTARNLEQGRSIFST